MGKNGKILEKIRDKGKKSGLVIQAPVLMLSAFPKN